MHRVLTTAHLLSSDPVAATARSGKKTANEEWHYCKRRW